jgi:hypothetical protein
MVYTLIPFVETRLTSFCHTHFADISVESAARGARDPRFTASETVFARGGGRTQQQKQTNTHALTHTTYARFLHMHTRVHNTYVHKHILTHTKTHKHTLTHNLQRH